MKHFDTDYPQSNECVCIYYIQVVRGEHVQASVLLVVRYDF